MFGRGNKGFGETRTRCIVPLKGSRSQLKTILKPTETSLADYLWPEELRRFILNKIAPLASTVGNIEILRNKKVAFFCSVKCPAHLILKAHDSVHQFREERITVISGYHSPIEQECLRILLRGVQPIILCPARSLTGMKLPKELIEPLEEGRILFLSPFKETERRNSEKRAVERNRFVAALADQVLVAYAAPNSKTEQFCQEILNWKKPLYTLESEANKNLLQLGAMPIEPNLFME